ncbi:MotA/TolQ/ExbB proton channel family protein [Crenobacter caeni]|uniref:MotA/TolQ/ExbB proton channel family protein n=1 Tax=Crenobacter caeni TaxID=2705474 RepID=A0A6B2KUT9_9NEIS|nr:MotA/TolQ/ExbB proton channel family protein [Crenobacter caeni]
MWAIIEAAGWPIWTIITASVISLAIILERLFTLRASRIAPAGLADDAIAACRTSGPSEALVQQLAAHSPLGRVLSAGVRNALRSREVMKEAIEDEGRLVGHELERYLTTLGTIAAMSPLLGLLGTVIGMIEIFGSQSPTGTNPQQLAHGISVALYNTAFGLIVAIPSMIFYRYFRARVDSLLVEMEAQAIRLVEAVQGLRSGG